MSTGLPISCTICTIVRDSSYAQSEGSAAGGSWNNYHVPALVPFVVAGLLAASSVLAVALLRGAALVVMTVVGLWSEPAPADQCFKYVSTPMDTIQVLLHRPR